MFDARVNNVQLRIFEAPNSLARPRNGVGSADHDTVLRNLICDEADRLLGCAAL
jgi:hypothetical protein